MGDYGDTCVNTGDTAWVLLSFILVLGMTPALALFEAGLLRSKNTLSLITQMLSGMVVLNVMWDLFGFSLVYGPDQVRGCLSGVSKLNRREIDARWGFSFALCSACLGSEAWVRGTYTAGVDLWRACVCDGAGRCHWQL